MDTTHRQSHPIPLFSGSSSSPQSLSGRESGGRTRRIALRRLMLLFAIGTGITTYLYLYCGSSCFDSPNLQRNPPQDSEPTKKGNLEPRPQTGVPNPGTVGSPTLSPSSTPVLSPYALWPRVPMSPAVSPFQTLPIFSPYPTADCSSKAFPDFPSAGALKFHQEKDGRLFQTNADMRVLQGVDVKQPCEFAEHLVELDGSDCRAHRSWLTETREMRPITIVALVTFDSEVGMMKKRLLASPVFHDAESARKHQLIILDVRQSAPFRKIVTPSLYTAVYYNLALLNASHDTVLFTHPDVYLPANALPLLEDSLTALEEVDAHWAVAGAVGKRGVVSPTKPDQLDTQFFGTFCNLDFLCFATKEAVLGSEKLDSNWAYPTPHDKPPIFYETDSIDENAIIVNRPRVLAAGVGFDPLAYSHHFVATSLIMDARIAGLRSYLLPQIPIWHRIGVKAAPQPGLSELEQYLQCKYQQKPLTESYLGRPLLPVITTNIESLIKPNLNVDCPRLFWNRRCALWKKLTAWNYPVEMFDLFRKEDKDTCDLWVEATPPPTAPPPPPPVRSPRPRFQLPPPPHRQPPKRKKPAA